MGEQEIESGSKAGTLIRDSFLWHVFRSCSACLTDRCQCTALQLSMILTALFLKLGLGIYTARLVPLVVY